MKAPSPGINGDSTAVKRYRPGWLNTVLLGGALWLGLNSSLLAAPCQQVQNLPIAARARLAGQVFDLEVARTPGEQQIGLMCRTAMPADRGMVFVFDPARPIGFWMRNTLIPLDMIFIRQGRIVSIQSAAPPCKTPDCPLYGTSTPVEQVVELNSGTARKLGLTPGDAFKVEFLAQPLRQSGQ